MKVVVSTPEMHPLHAKAVWPFWFVCRNSDLPFRKNWNHRENWKGKKSESAEFQNKGHRGFKPIPSPSARSGEGEHGQRYRDWHVDAHLAHVNFSDKPVGCRARSGEHRGAVAVRVPVNQIHRVVQSFRLQHTKYRAENFFLKNLKKEIQLWIFNRHLITAHFWFHSREHLNGDG